MMRNLREFVTLGLIFLISMIVSYFVSLNLEFVNFIPEFPKNIVEKYKVYLANYPENATVIVRYAYHSKIVHENDKWTIQIRTPIGFEIVCLSYNSTHHIQCTSLCKFRENKEIIFFDPYLLVNKCNYMNNKGKIYNFVLNTTYGNLTCNPFLFCFDNKELISICYNKDKIQHYIYKIRKEDGSIFFVEGITE